MRKKKEPVIHLPFYPTRKCPVCGKTWLMYCKDDEWGYAYRDSGHGHKAKKTVLLCSQKCMAAYARECERENAEHVEKLQCFEVWWMYDQEWMSVSEIAKKTGIQPNNVQNMIYLVENIYWREAEYIATQRCLAAV